jgi:hypothetical protein
MNDLPAPPDAANDPASTEVVRAWLIGGDLHCSLRAGVFDDPATWGAVLADVARYVAEAFTDLDGSDQAKTLAAIRAAFAQELDTPAGGA